MKYTKEIILVIIILILFYISHFVLSYNERNPRNELMRDIEIYCDGRFPTTPDPICEGLYELDGMYYAIELQKQYLIELYKNTFKL